MVGQRYVAVYCNFDIESVDRPRSETRKLHFVFYKICRVHLVKSCSINTEAQIFGMLLRMTLLPHQYCNLENYSIIFILV